MQLQVMASTSSSPATATTLTAVTPTTSKRFGRRQMVLALNPNSHQTSSSRSEDKQTFKMQEINTSLIFLSSRRKLLASSVLGFFWNSRNLSEILIHSTDYCALCIVPFFHKYYHNYCNLKKVKRKKKHKIVAFALGDPTVKIEDVTPQIMPFGALFPSEERMVQLFEMNTYAVVNIFDVTLRPQLNVTGVVEIPEGNGSGVVWDNSGHIVTNYHVVGSALSRNPKPGEIVARVNILASEGVQKNFEGKLIGADRAKDLAVIKVDAPLDILRPIKVGKSSDLKVGQQCLAIGNPFGFDHTLTVGVISGLNRDIFSKAGVTIGGGIQTDAAINPGNSGGPMLDSKGNMIGINTAIFTQTGTSAGVGFAIPSSTVLKIVPQLIQLGRVVRAGLNIEIAPDLVANQLNVRNGALVLLVPANSQGAKAGLAPTKRGFAGNIILGDIITAVDNKPIRSKSDLLKTLDDYKVGDSVKLKLRRDNQDLEINVVLEEIK